MSSVLTENSTLTCAHAGSLQLVAGQTKLSVGGAKVLVEGDLNGAAVSACATVPDPNTSTLKCLNVASATGGVAGKLKVGGRGVLLEEIKGSTNGTVGGAPQNWSVQSAGQSKLKAV
ncbi:MAG TPA: hypothetical protein VLA73_11715 [Burkholderiales bacterium]|nr:hypothetical protein [Burkholderiales bacterium]